MGAKISKRPPMGQRLISSMEHVLEAMEQNKPLQRRQVLLPPPPPVFDQRRVLGLRQRYGISQSYLAELLKVKSKTVQSWEQGARHPSGAASRLLQLLENPDIFQQLLPKDLPSLNKANNLKATSSTKNRVKTTGHR